MVPRYNFAKWWHLLSLDAPTIAILWSWVFAHAMHLHIPLLSILFLPAATWLLYVADRILDGLRHDWMDRERTDLRERHIFHARHRQAFVLTALILAALLAYLVFTHMYPQALRDNLFLSMFALLYLFLVHTTSRFGRVPQPGWLPKELAVGIIFAAATAVPAWSRMYKCPDLQKVHLAQAVILFALLCWINCVAIEKWEGGWPVPLESSTFTAAHRSTRWAGAHLKSIVSAIALFSVAGAWSAQPSGLGEVYLAAFLSSALFFGLDAQRSLFSPFSLRIAADAAMLTPLAIFLIHP